MNSEWVRLNFKNTTSSINHDGKLQTAITTIFFNF
jgi:hypothetical protein